MSKDCYAPRRSNNGMAAPANQARMNAIVPERANFNAQEQQNLEGTLTLYNSHAKVLFDTGATNSFIAHRVVQDLGLVPQNLDVALNAVSPLGVTVKLGKVCKECALTLEDHELPVDLIVLAIREFDVILGIDWLTKFHANMDCVSK